MARRTLLFLCALLLGGAVALPQAQSLSSQVLQLLIRTNTWTGRQTFYDLRLPDASPADTSARLYQIAGVLYWNGSLVSGGGGGGSPHTLLSTTHTDTSAAAVARGAIITGQGASPAWARLTIGSAGTVLRSDGTDVAWSTDGSGLTALNASQVTSGTLPLARLSGITNTEIAAGASIGWTKIDKTGSSLADLTTRSAGDLTSGSLADARLSANVSLFGASVDNAEITNATILFAKWASNGCSSGQYPQYNGSAWVCGTVTPGSGTVTSVGLTMPAIFSVTGSPVTGSGSLAASLAAQTANLVWAGPSTGSPAAPTFRSLVYNDLPTSAAAAGTYPKVTINAQGIVTGTASQITLTTDVTGVLPLANGGTGLNAAADDSVLLSNGSAWAAAALSNCTTGLTYTTATNTFGCASAVGSHALLSASHSDTLAASVVRGDLIVGNTTPQWTRLAVGANTAVLTSNGTDPAWSTAPNLTGINVGSATYGTGLIVVDTSGTAVLATAGTVYTRIAGGGGNNHIDFYGSHATYGDPHISLAAGIFGGTPLVGYNQAPFVFDAWVAEASSGTHTRLVGAQFSITEVGGVATTTTAATVRIANVPTVGASNYALWVDDGLARFDSGMVERGRTTPVGEWNTVTYAAGDYTGSGSLTWTVDSGDVANSRYTDIGTTMIWSLGLTNTSTGGTASTELRVTLPGSRTVSATTTGACAGIDNGTEVAPVWTATAGNSYVSFFRTIGGANWSNASTNATSIRCMVQVAF